jgi:enamine deaminase RidA (YjgF/YER057c/UK114 family)
MRISERVAELGHALPTPPTPVGMFELFTTCDDLVFLAGQFNETGGSPTVTGLVGAALDLAAGREAALLAGLNLLGSLAVAVDDDLDRVVRFQQVRGFVAAAPTFPDVPKVVNAASELFISVFGDRGRHARTAVGVSVLPHLSVVEVDAIVRVRP